MTKETMMTTKILLARIMICKAKEKGERRKRISRCRLPDKGGL
jgi:hypothetical protein